jgi:hypothetical protein
MVMRLESTLTIAATGCNAKGAFSSGVKEASASGAPLCGLKT